MQKFYPTIARAESGTVLPLKKRTKPSLAAIADGVPTSRPTLLELVDNALDKLDTQVGHVAEGKPGNLKELCSIQTLLNQARQQLAP